MTLDDSHYCQQDDPPESEPAWVTGVLRFLPVPIFAFAVMTTAATVSLISAIFANMEQLPVAWVLSGFFGTIAIVIAAASTRRRIYRRRSIDSDLQRYKDSERRSTVAILVFMISTYSWILTIGIHLFAANRLGGMKYYVTLSIAIASSVYMKFHGRSLIRDQFGTRGGRNIAVSPQQAIVVFLVITCFSTYFMWIMS